MNGLLYFNGVQKYRACANPIQWGMMVGVGLLSWWSPATT